MIYLLFHYDFTVKLDYLCFWKRSSGCWHFDWLFVSEMCNVPKKKACHLTFEMFWSCCGDGIFLFLSLVRPYNNPVFVQYGHFY